MTAWTPRPEHAGTAAPRFLTGDGRVTPAEHLAALDPATEADVHGDGGAVAQLEAMVAGLLGAPAAVFLPSGTMAQAAVLRVHADTRPAAVATLVERTTRYLRVVALPGGIKAPPVRAALVTDLLKIDPALRRSLT